MAEIELSVCSRQCLNRRVGAEVLRREVAALERERNDAGAVDWRSPLKTPAVNCNIYPSGLNGNGTRTVSRKSYNHKEDQAGLSHRVEAYMVQSRTTLRMWAHEHRRSTLPGMHHCLFCHGLLRVVRRFRSGRHCCQSAETVRRGGAGSRNQRPAKAVSAS